MYTVLVLWLALVASGCGGGGQGSPGDLQDPATSQGVQIDYELRPGTLVLDPALTGVELKGDEVRLTGAVPTIVSGNVIIVTQGAGALRKVTSVTRTDGVTVLQTTQASLAEAFERLDLSLDQVLGPETMGTPVSNTPGVTLEWVDGSPGTSRDLTTTETTFRMRLAMDNVELQTGVRVSGSTTFTLNPKVRIELVDDPAASTPIVTVQAILEPDFQGDFVVESEFGGSLSKELKEEIPLRPIVAGPIVLVPKILVSSSIEGSAAGSFTSTFSMSAGGRFGVVRDASRQTTGIFEPRGQASSEHDDVEGQVGVTLDVIRIGLRMDVYGVGGPYVAIAGGAEATGEFAVDDQDREGILLTVSQRLVGEVGIEAAFEVDVDVLEELFEDGEVAFFLEKTFPFGEPVELFFPFPGSASVIVRDNGNSPDDVFAVALDGVVLGQTALGGSGQFQVGTLAPGQHTLTVTCLQDTDPPGTLEIALGNGVTFLDGSVSLSDTLDLGASRDYVIQVPTQPRTSATPPAMRRSTVQENRRSPSPSL